MPVPVALTVGPANALMTAVAVMLAVLRLESPLPGVSVAAALALPLSTDEGLPFPGREEIVACTLAVILATLFLQGRNLMNEDIRLSTSYVKDTVPMPGRSFYAGMRVRF